MRLALLALLLTTACGNAREAVDVRSAAVAWEISPDGLVADCSNNRDLFVENFPSGWRCHWACASYGESFYEAWVALPVEDGRWVSMPDAERPIALSRCWGEAPCPEGFPCE